MTDLKQENVIKYLEENPEFLDNFVQSYVSEEKLQRWAEKKCRRRLSSVGIRTPVVNGETASSVHREQKDHIYNRSKWKTNVQSGKWKVIHKLTCDLSQQTNRLSVLQELSSCAMECANADGYNLYVMDERNHLRHQLSHPHGFNRHRSMSVVGKKDMGTTVASYVAYTRDTIRTSDVTEDSRFPKGLGIKCDKAQSVIAVPVLNGKDGILGVIEFYREFGNIPFSSEDEEISASLLVWADILVDYVELTDKMFFAGSIAVYYKEIYNSMTKQRKLNDFLLAVTKSIFQDIVSMDTVIVKIMNYAKKLVNADRASLFLLDSNTNELYARIFDTGRADETVPQKEIRFPMDRGVAGYVASTGNVLNIPDAYTDDRFNRDVDLQTGYRTKTILCMPIYIRGSIIGVVQMVNKQDGKFSKADEESFATFSIYCGLALHHAKLYDKIRRSEQKYKVALDVLSYHSQCSDEEFLEVKTKECPPTLPQILDYNFSPWSVSNDFKPVHVLYMMKDIFDGARGRKNEKRFDTDDIIRFTLTVRKNYRNVPYHNWDHAFSVAHAMFTVIKTAKHKFSALESLALFVACLCHDLDHRGKTNAFMVKSASPLASIYSTSTMEHHHFNHTITILQNEGHNIFKYLNSDEYKQILDDIKHCILATDLALFFSNRARLQENVDKNEFDWEIREDRYTLMANCMTACDLCSMYKPWDTQLDLVYVIMEEFWQQGDEEKAQGMTPMPMMDREKQNELPQLEVGFLVGICLPCYELMAKVLPETKPMVDGATANLKKWKELAEQKDKSWQRKTSPKVMALAPVNSTGKCQTSDTVTENKENNFDDQGNAQQCEQNDNSQEEMLDSEKTETDAGNS